MIVTTVLSQLTMADVIVVMDFLSPKGYKQPCLVFCLFPFNSAYLKWHSGSSVSKQINKTFSYYYYLLIGNHYFPPDTKPEIITNYFRFLENKLDTHNFRAIIVGNFNTPGFD
jgi:hypothetical protein